MDVADAGAPTAAPPVLGGETAVETVAEGMGRMDMDAEHAVDLDAAVDVDAAEAFVDPDTAGIDWVEDKDGAPPPDEDADGGDDAEVTAEAASAAEGGTDMETEGGAPEPEVDDAVYTLTKHTDVVAAVAVRVCEDGGYCFASGACDDKAYSWHLAADSAAESKMAELSGHTDTVVSIEYSVDGKFLATAGMDGLVKVWDARADVPAVHKTLEGPDELLWGCWHPKGPVYLGGAQDCTTWMWNAATGKCGGFTPNGKRVFTGSSDCCVRVYDPRTAETIAHFRGAAMGGLPESSHPEPISTLAACPSAPMILSGGEDGTLLLLQHQTGKVLSNLKHHEDSVEGAIFLNGTGDARMAATCSVDGTWVVWDVSSLRKRYEGKNESGFTNMAKHPTNENIVCLTTTDGCVQLWDCRTSSCVKEMKGHTNIILSVKISSDGRTVVTSSEDHTVKVFSLDMGPAIK